MELWERITKARTTAGMSQTQACLSLGVEQAELEAWERGERELSISQLTKMCQVYNASSDFLLGGNDREGKFTKTYTIVVKPKNGCAIDIAITGIRDFFSDSKFCMGGALPTGKLLSDCTAEEVSQVRDYLIHQVTGNNAVILCRRLPYNSMVNTMDLFYNKANVYAYFDEAGTDLDTLLQTEPAEKYIYGEPRFSTVRGIMKPANPQGSQTPWQPQQQVVVEKKGDSTVRTLVIIALVLLIIVLIFALL